MKIPERQMASFESAPAARLGPAEAMPAVDMQRAWAAMTNLRSLGSATAHSVVSPDLALTLGILGEAVHLAGPSGARRVPSAGAIFPYETLALCRLRGDRDSVEWGLFRIEGAAGICTRVPIPRPWLQRLVAAMPGARAFSGCYLIVLTRPWLSIRKYGPRGYLYTQLDAAHAAVNILGVALSTGTALLHAGLSPEAETALRDGFAPFYELHSVIQVSRVAEYETDPTVTVRSGLSAPRSALAYDFEVQAWASLVAPLHAATAAWIPVEPQDSAVLALPDARPDLALRAEWRELSAVRRSAKRFGTEPLSGAQLAGTIGGLATPLPTTLGHGPVASTDGSPSGRAAVSATVIVNDRLELSPAEHLAITCCARLVRYPASSDAMPHDVTSFVASCMGQPHVGRSQAFVLLHAPADLSGAGASGRDLRRALFRAGVAAQLLCLAATREQVAVSPIGGFDSAIWARIAELPVGSELLYLLALGAPVAESGPARNDRAEKAIAHGES